MSFQNLNNLFTAAFSTACTFICTAQAYSAHMTPTSQKRTTGVFVSTVCEGEQAQGQSAKGFGPFQSELEIVQICDVENTFGWSTAEMDSAISDASLIGAGRAYAAGETLEEFELSVSAHSSYTVSFELTSPSTFRQEGILNVQGGGPNSTIYASASLIGPEYNQEVFNHFLVGGGGVTASEELTPAGPLEPGLYTYQVEAFIFSGDVVQLSPEGQADYDFSFEVFQIGDVNGDHRVDVNDLRLVIKSWGACPKAATSCPADVNLDGQVNVNDLRAVILNWS